MSREPWIWAENPATPENDDSPWVGKWLLFIPEPEIDPVWDQIKEDTEAGRLGVGAKRSNMRPGKYPNGNVVICVYTKDCRDLADVKRVLARLRELGHTDRLNYKEDLATLAGRYEGGQSPASLYTSRTAVFIKQLRSVVKPDEC